MMSSSDPRVHKPRLPKAYSEAELAFLKSHLPEFERRSQGSIRGDAKKFALERATEFITTFGLPAEFQDVTEPEPRFREQIYNWYKNTIGRTRRKLEGRPRSKKAAEKAAQSNITWPTNLATPTTIPYSQVNSSQAAHPVTHSSTVLTPQYYQPNVSSTSASASGSTSNLKPNLNVSNLCDAFLNPTVDASALSTMIQTSALSNPSRTPLTPVIQSLFEAITLAQSSQSGSSSAVSYPNGDPSYQLLRRFVEASSFFPPTISHANVSGPLSGPRALQMAIRISSVWTPMGYNPGIPSSGPSMSYEMERIAIDRQRRKDYIQWARVHAAALELGMLGVNGDSSGLFVNGRSASEVMARDSVWQEDEVEWCAGICVLRAIIRTGLRGGPGQRQEYEDLLRTYEGRWKEIKDEARQGLVTEVLLAAKDELARLMEQPHTTA